MLYRISNASSKMKHYRKFIVMLLVAIGFGVLEYTSYTLEGLYYRPQSRKLESKRINRGSRGLTPRPIQPIHNDDSSNMSTDISIYMEGCPLGWTLEVLKNTSEGHQPSQVCRSDTKAGQWICAPGWKHVNVDPYCRRKLENNSKSNSNRSQPSKRIDDFDEESFQFQKHLVDKPTKECTIHIYFQKIPSKPSAQIMEDEKTIDVWRDAWSSAGWQPRIISEENAKTHPDYERFRRRVSTFPTINNKDYELSCFMRYLAMANVGGGWMSDYDVLPYHIPPCTAPFHNGSFTTYQGFVPALVSGTAAEYTRVAMLMENTDWQSNPKIYSANGRPHVSDMLCLLDLSQKGLTRAEHTIDSPNVIFRTPFHCNNTKEITPQYKRSLIDMGVTSLPFAVHYSHSSCKWFGNGTMIPFGNKNTMAQIKKSRRFLMEVAHKYWIKTCHP